MLEHDHRVMPHPDEALEGVVSALLVKPARDGPLVPVARVEARAGHGLAGDCHAQPLGPRQVLIVREEGLEDLGVEPQQVGANIVARDLPEDALCSGSVLRAGGATIRVTHACEVCKVLRRQVSEESFRALPGRRGSLGIVLDGGAVEVGGQIHGEPARYPVVPDGVYDRLAWVVGRIPEGKVVTYSLLATLVGSPRAYSRVLPTYLQRAGRSGLPAHRVLTSGAALSRHLPGQAELLAREGVVLRDGVLADEGRLWDGRALYRVKR